jgi:hypothetical protein
MKRLFVALALVLALGNGSFATQVLLNRGLRTAPVTATIGPFPESPSISMQAHGCPRGSAPPPRVPGDSTW